MNSPGDETPRPESTPPVEPPLPDVEGLEACLRWRSRRGFAPAGAAVLTDLLGWRWLVTRTWQEGLDWPLRRDDPSGPCRDPCGVLCPASCGAHHQRSLRESSGLPSATLLPCRARHQDPSFDCDSSSP